MIESGTPPFQFQWLKNGQALERTDSKTIVTGEEISSLTFRQLTSEDTGNYTCLVKNREGSDSHTAQLLIKCKLSHMFLSNEFILSSDSQLHLDGRRNLLHLSKWRKGRLSHLSVLPMGNRVRLSLSWRRTVGRESALPLLNLFSNHFSVIGGTWTRVLLNLENTITRVSKSHAGDYRCRADNGLEAVDTDFQLLVLGTTIFFSLLYMLQKLVLPATGPLCELQSKWGALVMWGTLVMRHSYLPSSPPSQTVREWFFLSPLLFSFAISSSL